VLFKAPTGEQSQAQIEAFQDTWYWNSAPEAAFEQLIHAGNSAPRQCSRFSVQLKI
jgi:site-specific DNA-methyltransferase (adenine-specific)